MFFRKKEEKEEVNKEYLEPQNIKIPTLREIEGEAKKTSAQTFEEEKTVEKEAVEKVSEQVEEEVEIPLQAVEEEPETEEEEKPVEEEVGEKKYPEELKRVPLFIKLEKYEEMVNTIDEIKNVLKLLKNSFVILEENEKIRSETVETIKGNINKIEEKIADLDSVLLRSTSQEEVKEEESYKSEEVRDTLSALKMQIDKLKSELQALE